MSNKTLSYMKRNFEPCVNSQKSKSASTSVQTDQSLCCKVLYFFSFKTEAFTFQNSPDSLDPTYKTDLDYGLED